MPTTEPPGAAIQNGKRRLVRHLRVSEWRDGGRIRETLPIELIAGPSSPSAGASPRWHLHAREAAANHEPIEMTTTARMTCGLQLPKTLADRSNRPLSHSGPQPWQRRSIRRRSVIQRFPGMGLAPGRRQVSASCWLSRFVCVCQRS